MNRELLIFPSRRLCLVDGLNGVQVIKPQGQVCEQNSASGMLLRKRQVSGAKTPLTLIMSLATHILIPSSKIQHRSVQVSIPPPFTSSSSSNPCTANGLIYPLLTSQPHLPFLFPNERGPNRHGPDNEGIVRRYTEPSQSNTHLTHPHQSNSFHSIPSQSNQCN